MDMHETLTSAQLVALIKTVKQVLLYVPYLVDYVEVTKRQASITAKIHKGKLWNVSIVQTAYIRTLTIHSASEGTV